MAIQYHELSEQMQQLNDRLEHQVQAYTLEPQRAVGRRQILGSSPLVFSYILEFPPP